MRLSLTRELGRVGDRPLTREVLADVDRWLSVDEALLPRDELLAVGRSQEEAAALGIAEELDREPREPVRLLEPAQLAGRDVQLVEPVRDVRVVLEVARALRLALTPRPVEPPVLTRERPEQELGQPASRDEQVVPAEPPRGLRQRRQREPVPGRDRLVVEERLRPLLP